MTVAGQVCGFPQGQGQAAALRRRRSVPHTGNHEARPRPARKPVKRRARPAPPAPLAQDAADRRLPASDAQRRRGWAGARGVGAGHRRPYGRAGRSSSGRRDHAAALAPAGPDPPKPRTLTAKPSTSARPQSPGPHRRNSEAFDGSQLIPQREGSAAMASAYRKHEVAHRSRSVPVQTAAFTKRGPLSEPARSG